MKNKYLLRNRDIMEGERNGIQGELASYFYDIMQTRRKLGEDMALYYDRNI